MSVQVPAFWGDTDLENAQLIGLSKQVALRRELDVVANNLANINTAGFKRHEVLFEDYLMPVAEYGARRNVDETLHYVSDRATIRDFSEGSFEQTGSAYDVALQGDGWLVVETADGPRYTRNGAMTTNASGQLVTHSGDPVAGADGPINIPNDASSIAIARDGTISADGNTIGRLRVVKFQNMADLIADDGTLFRSNATPIEDTSTTVQQGMLERANVRGVLEIARLIEITRAYTSLTSAMDRTDKLRQTAIQTLGQV